MLSGTGLGRLCHMTAEPACPIHVPSRPIALACTPLPPLPHPAHTMPLQPNTRSSLRRDVSLQASNPRRRVRLAMTRPRHACVAARRAHDMYSDTRHLCSKRAHCVHAHTPPHPSYSTPFFPTEPLPPPLLPEVNSIPRFLSLQFLQIHHNRPISS